MEERWRGGRRRRSSRYDDRILASSRRCPLKTGGYNLHTSVPLFYVYLRNVQSSPIIVVFMIVAREWVDRPPMQLPSKAGWRVNWPRRSRSGVMDIHYELKHEESYDMLNPEGEESE